MNKLKCVVSYDGTNFSGYQIQPKKRTIQAEIEAALQRMHKGEWIRIQSSGRTDKGVHAIKQVFHFETALNIPSSRWRKALNTLLPNDIRIIEVEAVSEDFHARYSAVAKEYRYFILNRAEPDLFQRNYVYHERDVIDMTKLQAACKKFEGTHDFTSFCSAKATIKGSRVRTLYEVSCHREEDKLELIFRGDGFLYHMVRIIVSVVLDVAKGKIPIEEIDTLFALKNRENVGITIPPEGLYLWDVVYKKDK